MHSTSPAATFWPFSTLTDSTMPEVCGRRGDDRFGLGAAAQRHFDRHQLGASTPRCAPSAERHCRRCRYSSLRSTIVLAVLRLLPCRPAVGGDALDGFRQRATIGLDKRNDRTFTIAGAVAAVNEGAGTHPDTNDNNNEQVQRRRTRSHAFRGIPVILYSAASASCSGRARAMSSFIWVAMNSRAT